MNHIKRLLGRPFKLGGTSVRVCTIYVFTDVFYTAREHSGRSGVLPQGCVCAAGCVSAYVFDAATLSGDNEWGGEKNWEENRWNARTRQKTQNSERSHKDVPISQPPLTVEGSRVYSAVRDNKCANQEKSREGHFHMWVLALNHYWVLQKIATASGLCLPVQTHNRHSQRSRWLLTTISNHFILESEWTCVPNLKRIPRGVPEISCSQQWKGWTGTCGQTENPKTSPTRRHKNLMKNSHIPTCKL